MSDSDGDEPNIAKYVVAAAVHVASMIGVPAPQILMALESGDLPDELMQAIMMMAAGQMQADRERAGASDTDGERVRPTGVTHFSESHIRLFSCAAALVLVVVCCVLLGAQQRTRTTPRQLCC